MTGIMGNVIWVKVWNGICAVNSIFGNEREYIGQNGFSIWTENLMAPSTGHSNCATLAFFRDIELGKRRFQDFMDNIEQTSKRYLDLGHPELMNGHIFELKGEGE